jgi:hypothetical protein
MTLVHTDRNQVLRILDGRFSIEHSADRSGPVPAVDWLALANGPDGRTVIQRDDDAADGGWAALWSGDERHDPETTGMLSAIVAPLADGGMPVMVASTFHADLVLVRAERLDDAVTALRAAGHRVIQ